MTKAKTESVRKRGDGLWEFLHPQTKQWTGTEKTRVAARSARAALKGATAEDAPEEEVEVVGEVVNESEVVAEKDVDSAGDTHVDSSTVEPTALNDSTPSTQSPNTNPTGATMQIKFIKSNKARKSTSVVFTAEGNPRFSARFAKTGFAGGVAPESITVEAPDEAFASAKPKLTAEQRKEARKNAPKLTPAQKLAKLQERAAALQSKIDAENAAKAAAPQA